MLCILLQDGDGKAHSPRFPKAKDEGWWLVLGEVDSKELLALKRVGVVRRRNRTSLTFLSPDTACRKIYTVFLMSDCYLGLDSQCDIHLHFTV